MAMTQTLPSGIPCLEPCLLIQNSRVDENTIIGRTAVSAALSLCFGLGHYEKIIQACDAGFVRNPKTIMNHPANCGGYDPSLLQPAQSLRTEEISVQELPSSDANRQAIAHFMNRYAQHHLQILERDRRSIAARFNKCTSSCWRRIPATPLSLGGSLLTPWVTTTSPRPTVGITYSPHKPFHFRDSRNEAGMRAMFA